MNAIDDLKRLAGLEPYRRYLDMKPQGDDTHKALCPWHNDSSPSLVIYADAHHHCFACGAHGDALDLIQQLDRCELDQAKQRLEEIAGFTPQAIKEPGEPVAVYPYRNEKGVLLFEVLRYKPKTFRQRRPDGDGGWTWKLGDVRRPLYRLSEVLKTFVVWFVEGEKDADNCKRQGLTATTTAGGANAPWLSEYNDALTGKTVYIIPDNDEPGRKRAQRVHDQLKGAADEVLIVPLPDQFKDVSDYFAAGYSAEDLRALIGPARERAKQAPAKWWHGLPILAALTSPPVRFLVPNLLPDGGLVMIVGKPGAFKSFLALDLCRAVSTGASFAGLVKSEARPVLYLDAENSLPIIVSRREFLAIPSTLNFRYWGRFSGRPFPALNDPDLRDFAAQEKPLLVVDSFIRFHHGSENDNAEVAATMAHFLDLARLGATVLLLHHAGKDREKVYRGAMELEAAPDLCFRVERTGERDIRLAAFKNRYGQERAHDLRLSEFGFEWLAGTQEVEPWAAGEEG